jgi:mono/diheme cytochrome c family protein
MRIRVVLFLPVVLALSCKGNRAPQLPSAKDYGSQIVEVSGGKQMTAVGSTLPQPVVVQVNSADGNPVTGALVTFRGEGLNFSPAAALSDSSGQVTTSVQVGFNAGDYQIVAETPKHAGGAASLNLREIALGYEATLGRTLNEQYCIRCHDPESTPERVSNMDNLSPAPHQFSDGATYNRLQDTDLINLINRGGLAAGKSTQMPPYSSTLTPAETRALLAYIRAVADPPYQPSGVKYEK